jgi:hypothetical protein
MGAFIIGLCTLIDFRNTSVTVSAYEKTSLSVVEIVKGRIVISHWPRAWAAVHP